MDIEKIIKNHRNTIYLTLTIIFVLFAGYGFCFSIPKDMRMGIFPAINELRLEIQNMNNRLDDYQSHRHSYSTGKLYFPEEDKTK